MGEYRVTIHPTAEVHHTAHIGHGSVLWAYCLVMEGAQLGDDCMLGRFAEVASHAVIGAHCRIQPHVIIPPRTVLGNYVYVGPHVTLADVRYPCLWDRSRETREPVRVEDCAWIGANAVVCPGVIIRMGAIVGAGAVVTRDVPSYAKVAGNPARIIGYRSPGEVEPLMGGHVDG